MAARAARTRLFFPNHGGGCHDPWTSVRSGATILLLTLISNLGLLVLSGCKLDAVPPTELLGGDIEQGRQAIRKHDCGTCRGIPGMLVADGLTGPPLIRWPQRAYIAGNLPNTPEN